MKKIVLLALTLLTVFFTQFSFADADGFSATLIRGTSMPNMRLASSIYKTDIAIINFTDYTINARAFTPGGRELFLQVTPGDTGAFKGTASADSLMLKLTEHVSGTSLFENVVCHHAIVTVDIDPVLNRFRINVNDRYCY